MMEIIPESEWDGLYGELISHKGTAIIIGATDSGKSTLAKYLLQRLISENIKVCLIDSDVGQSSLGLPGTVSIKLFCNQKDMEDFMFEKMSFMGTVNPAKKIPFIINTTKRMVDMCRINSDITLIDTSGLVVGETGKALKISKIRSVKPEHIIAVQRYDELEHILELIETSRIHRIKTSQAAKIRTVAIRTQYRKKKLQNYFNKNETSDFLLKANEIKFFYNNKPFIPNKDTVKKGTLIGLNHGEDTIALGILNDISENSVTFRSPIKSIKNINKVIFGDMTIEHSL